MSTEQDKIRELTEINCELNGELDTLTARLAAAEEQLEISQDANDILSKRCVQ